MDHIDRKLLKILRKNARITNRDLAKELGLPPSSTLERVRKLEKNSVIQGYEAKIDSRKLGLGLTVFISIKTNEKMGETGVGEKLAELPEICGLYDVGGEYAYFAKVVVADTDELCKLMTQMGKIRGVMESQTTLVLHTIKEDLSVEVCDENAVDPD